MAVHLAANVQQGHPLVLLLGQIVCSLLRQSSAQELAISAISQKLHQPSQDADQPKPTNYLYLDATK